MRRLFAALIFVGSAIGMLFLGSKAGIAGILISAGANATGSVTNSEDFESFIPSTNQISPFSTASGFTFSLTSGIFTIMGPGTVGLPTQSLYQLGGAHSMTTIELTSGVDIQSIQFDVGNGFYNNFQSLWIRPYENGVWTGFEFTSSRIPVGTFTVESTGTPFDEIRVQSADPYFLSFQSESEYGAASIDNVQVFSAVPEPSSFALLSLGGIGLAFGAYRRRRAAV